jgi:hypothetical protein
MRAFFEAKMEKNVDDCPRVHLSLSRQENEMVDQTTKGLVIWEQLHIRENLVALGTDFQSWVFLSQSGGRCCDHNFPRFSIIFGDNYGVFLKNQYYDPIFASFNFVLSQKRQFFTIVWRRYFKIITSVPVAHNF